MRWWGAGLFWSIWWGSAWFIGDSFPPHDTTFEVPTSYQKRGDLYAPYACLGWLDLAEALWLDMIGISSQRRPWMPNWGSWRMPLPREDALRTRAACSHHSWPTLFLFKNILNTYEMDIRQFLEQIQKLFGCSLIFQSFVGDGKCWECMLNLRSVVPKTRDPQGLWHIHSRPPFPKLSTFGPPQFVFQRPRTSGEPWEKKKGRPAWILLWMLNWFKWPEFRGWRQFDSSSVFGYFNRRSDLTINYICLALGPRDRAGQIWLDILGFR